MGLEGRMEGSVGYRSRCRLRRPVLFVSSFCQCFEAVCVAHTIPLRCDHCPVNSTIGKTASALLGSRVVFCVLLCAALCLCGAVLCCCLCCTVLLCCAVCHAVLSKDNVWLPMQAEGDCHTLPHQLLQQRLASIVASADLRQNHSPFLFLPAARQATSLT